MPKVYRFEGPDGRGVYNTRVLRGKAEELRWELMGWHSYSRDEDRPNLSTDFSHFDWTEEYRSGCETLQQLKEWFDGGFFEMFLKVKSIKLVEYDANLVVKGQSGKQVIFHYHENLPKKVIPKAGVRKIF